MALSDFFSSFKSTIYADSEESKEPEVAAEAVEEETEAEAEEEEEEPEDIQPVVRDECKETKCAQLAKHFEHCQEKVQSGQGFKGEDCVEELCMYSLSQ
ncbi:hypothetical protein P691DRAFT_760489 [Macrolepiota fuliginosa MF-IS2]|uniref:Ubiquinol-cytochrome C reductase hinge domain-containing protein n=1 Tax=Macrolepiota fuliginosa MF-IS2 TaxID=1400762 RepID=A0A9P5XEF1_9AGAR|nr:hypothetical protein P691DRAFT_760489 [Macrolepiota fuliginosa MF-IS2]